MPTGLFALSSIEPHICCLKIVFKIIVSTFLSHPALFVVMSECFSCKMQIDSDVKFCPGCGADQANKRLKQSLTGEGLAIVAAINGSLGAKIDVVDNKLTVFAAAPRTYQALRGCLQLHNIYILWSPEWTRRLCAWSARLQRERSRNHHVEKLLWLRWLPTAHNEDFVRAVVGVKLNTSIKAFDIKQN